MGSRTCRLVCKKYLTFPFLTLHLQSLITSSISMSGFKIWIVLNSSIKNVLLPRKRTLLLYKIKTYEPFIARKLFSNGADGGNRTRNLSLGSWYFTTKLHPHKRCYNYITLNYICQSLIWKKCGIILLTIKNNTIFYDRPITVTGFAYILKTYYNFTS